MSYIYTNEAGTPSRGTRAKLYFIDDLKDIKAELWPAESPTVYMSDVIQCIQNMENDLDILRNSHFQQFYDGYNTALSRMKDFFLGSQEVDEETGEIKHYLYGREI